MAPCATLEVGQRMQHIRVNRPTGTATHPEMLAREQRQPVAQESFSPPRNEATERQYLNARIR